MKVPPAAARKVIWEAMTNADGNRAKAAQTMGVSIRTFYRYITDLGLSSEMDKMGWTHHAGPPRGMPKGSSVIRERILKHVRAVKGDVDYADLTKEIYGEDDRASRQRIYSAMEDLKNQGRLKVVGERWEVVSEPTVKVG